MSDLSTLQNHLKNTRDNIDESLAVRLHRAISWCHAAARHSDDHDIRFITYWVAFCACYSVPDNQHTKLGERASFIQFVEKLTSRDATKRIASVLWETYPNAVRSLLDNPYVYPGFWVSQSEKNEAWRDDFQRESRRASRYVRERNVSKILALVLDRLSILRNQIVYGGATYQSKMNRTQLIDGADILTELIPAIIFVMLDASKAEWGEIFYPVVKSMDTPYRNDI